LMVSWLLPVQATSQSLRDAPDAVREIVDHVPEQLQSNDPKQVAWAAFHAGQYQLKAVIPLLENALDRFQLPDPSTRPNAAVRLGQAALGQSILDALVQLGASVDATSVARFFQWWPVQTLLLVNNARARRDEVLLSLLDVPSDRPLWQATANLILKTKPQGFAVLLLRGLKLRLTVYVTNRTDVGIFSGSGLGVDGEGCNQYVPGLPGYPPIADYQLPVAGPNGLSWPDNVGRAFYLRTVYAPPMIPNACGPLPVRVRPLDQDRLTYVAALLNSTPQALFLFASSSVTVVWTNAETLKARVAQERERVAAQYRSITARLAQGGYLSASEADGLVPPIEVTIQDQRDDRRDPLPTINTGQN
jgi:hypothetical protein